MINNIIIKKINKHWNLFGWVLLFAVLLRYLTTFNTAKDNIWDALWVCPITAISAGIALLFKDKFFISATTVWIIVGPLSTVLVSPEICFSLIGFHHFVSVFALILVFFHWKEIWNPKGLIFGITSFYAYMIITSNLSGGEVNLLNDAPFWLGIFLSIISFLIFCWSKGNLKNKLYSIFAKKGFTIIELVVVITIMAILATMIASNVVGYVNKTKDVKIKEDMGTIFTSSVIFYGTNFTWDGFFEDDFITSTITSIDNVIDEDSVWYNLNDDDTSWCICSKLLEVGISAPSKTYCIDSTGYKGTTEDLCENRCTSDNGVCE